MRPVDKMAWQLFRGYLSKPNAELDISTDIIGEKQIGMAYTLAESFLAVMKKKGGTSTDVSDFRPTAPPNA